MLAMVVLLLAQGSSYVRGRLVDDLVVHKDDNAAAITVTPVAWAAWRDRDVFADAMTTVGRAMEALLGDVGSLMISPERAGVSCGILNEECIARCGDAEHVLENECVGSSSAVGDGFGSTNTRVRCTCASDGGTQQYSSYREVTYTSSSSYLNAMSFPNVFDSFGGLSLHGHPSRLEEGNGSREGVRVVDLMSVGVSLPDNSGVEERRTSMSMCFMHAVAVCLFIVTFVLSLHACLFSNDEDWEEEEEEECEYADDEEGFQACQKKGAHGLVTIIVPEREPLLSAYEEEGDSESVQVISMSELLENARSVSGDRR